MLRGKRKLILKAALPTAGSLCQQGAVQQPVQLPEALPCKGVMFANRPSREHSGGGPLSLLYRGAKPVPTTARLTLPQEQRGTWRGPPHPLLPLLLQTPQGQGELQALPWLRLNQNNFNSQVIGIGEGAKEHTGCLLQALEQELGTGEPMWPERGGCAWHDPTPLPAPAATSTHGNSHSLAGHGADARPTVCPASPGTARVEPNMQLHMLQLLKVSPFTNRNK